MTASGDDAAAVDVGPAACSCRAKSSVLIIAEPVHLVALAMTKRILSARFFVLIG
jgi:hypothetical protein